MNPSFEEQKIIWERDGLVFLSSGEYTKYYWRLYNGIFFVARDDENFEWRQAKISESYEGQIEILRSQTWIDWYVPSKEFNPNCKCKAELRLLFGCKCKRS
jgi:hypothetical protein